MGTAGERSNRKGHALGSPAEQRLVGHLFMWKTWICTYRDTLGQPYIGEYVWAHWVLLSGGHWLKEG